MTTEPTQIIFQTRQDDNNTKFNNEIEKIAHESNVRLRVVLWTKYEACGAYRDDAYEKAFTDYLFYFVLLNINYLEKGPYRLSS